MTLNRLPWGLRGYVLLTVEALCVSSTGGCVSGRFLLWEPALVSFSISEMGITASLRVCVATDNFVRNYLVKKNKDLWY